jgi:hypothetical protein
MDKKTVGLIYAFKQCNKYNTDTVICKFMREWSNSSFWDVTTTSRVEIKRILRETIADYLATCGNTAEIRRYFLDNPVYGGHEFQHMISFLRMTQVKEQDRYVNGFYDNPYPDFEVFKQD